MAQNMQGWEQQGFQVRDKKLAWITIMAPEYAGEQDNTSEEVDKFESQ